MAIGTSLGAYFETPAHHLAGIDDNVIDPETTPDLGTNDKNVVPPKDSTMPPRGPTEPAGALKVAGGTSVPPETSNMNPLLPEGSFPDALHLDAAKDVNLIKGFYNTVKDAFSLPGDVYGGKIDPMSEQGIERAADLAGMMITGPAPVAAKMADGTLGSFMGVRSATFNPVALRRAQEMKEAGATNTEIWQKTGTFKGVDGRWRQEINDNESKVNEDWLNREPVKEKESSDPFEQIPFEPDKGKIVAPLPEVLDHPELYKAYPFLKNTKVKADTIGLGEGGAADLEGNAITLSKGNETDKSLLLHEVQHLIQNHEGFAQGGAPAPWHSTNLRFEDEVNAAHQRLSELFKKPGWTPAESAEWDKNVRLTDLDASRRLLAGQVAENNYRRLAGEAESRNVQIRDYYDAKEKRQVPPWISQDVPSNKQIVSTEPVWTTPYGISKDPSTPPPYSLGRARKRVGGGDYWSSTTTPRTAFDPIDPKVAAYLKENKGIDSKLLSADLGIQPNIIESYQRRLGLREFSNTRDKAK